MTNSDIDMVQRKYDAWNRGDVGELIEMTHPDFHWAEPAEMVGRESGRGRAAFARYLHSFLEVWEEFRWEPEEFTGAGELLMVVVLERGKGRRSGAPVAQRFAHVWQIRDGRSLSMERYVDVDAARRRLGAAA